ncbi:dehydrogenase [Desulfuribacillus stibiiarsenatis]|uniref:Dehydrogenase n=1 Tax=Desulfuribacillus stibiiarsenatis TaxID=1390249 RepID=A0A1E5L498_9FIRM|nr:molybdopterin-dependent oxidoreductase [Desulfuribacillus stibiiarsenatis]OEH84960.1 dehydrogenase [Desulfuribacillus stibiiarsenatis]
MKFNINRRTFLKVSSAAVAAASVSGLGKGLTTLKHASAQEAEIAAKSFGDVQVKYTADVMCPSECGMEMWIKNGKLWKIYGNKAVPYNDGACCGKGASGTQIVYSPQRLKEPMLRVGPRGHADSFKRVSWDEAIDFIAKKMKQIKEEVGPEAIIMDSGDITDRDQYWRLARGYGSPNVAEHGAICDTPRRHGPKLMFGGKRVEPDVMTPKLVRQANGKLEWDYTQRSKLIIYVGWNPFVATRINYESRGTVAAQVENNCKVIVVDPNFSNTASKADQWVPIRPGTDGDLFAAMLRYILENDNQKDSNKKYIDKRFEKASLGWEEFEKSFKEWWGKKDPINNLSYFSLDWAAARTGLTKEVIANMSHTFGITKPAALVWGMQSPGHHYNGYPASILGTVLNVITGNFDAPGGAIDTEITKWSKGGRGNGGFFDSRKIKRTVNGKEIETEQKYLHMELYGDWPAGWDQVVGNYPNLFRDGVTLKYGPLKGYKYPIRGYFQRTGNAVVTGTAPYDWQDALTQKKPNGEYKVDLSVFIDTLFLESALYADVILPEASYAERMSLSDIYPSYPMGYLRDSCIKPLHNSKNHTDIMNLIAKRLYELGDKDIDPKEFWEGYPTEEIFTNELLKPAPGCFNVGIPVPYPQYPEGYKLIGTPESLEAGTAKVDHEKKEVVGEYVTVAWLRKNKGVAVWPMSWHRNLKADKETPNKVWPPTSSKLIEFRFDRYNQYNKLIEETGIVPPGLKEIGFDKFPTSFYWFETVWNPYTNKDYAKYKDEYPFQLICGRVHQSMSGTHMVPWLSETPVEGLWMPLNKAFESEVVDVNPKKPEGYESVVKKFREGTFCVGTTLLNTDDAKKLGLKTGDLVEISNPLGKSTRSKVVVGQTIRPGVIKMGFATGGRFSPGMGPTYEHREYTPCHNTLTDPKALSPIMGQPAYADMIVKIKKI